MKIFKRVPFQAAGPDPVTGLSATPLGFQTINLAWTLPLGGVVFQSVIVEWSADGASGWTPITLASNAVSYSDATLSADTRRYYRVKTRNNTTGDSAPVSANAITATPVANALTGITWSILSAPRYMDTAGAWATTEKPTVRVEKGFGSAVFQNLYPYTNGQLYTLPNGLGQTATAFAAGQTLFVETPFNQALGDLVTGHPTAISSSRRVILDISIPACPRFRGINGAQDGAQHATERGYDFNVSFTNNDPLYLWSADKVVSGEHYIYQVGSGASPRLRCQSAPDRFYPEPETVVCDLFPSTVPTIRGQSHGPLGNDSTANKSAVVYNAGRLGETYLSTNSNTVNALRWMGPVNSLNGFCYGFALAKAADLAESKLFLTGIPKDLAALTVGDWAADELSIVSPRPYTVFNMSLGFHLGNINVSVLSGTGRAIEANFAGRGWVAIGTTDSNGVLQGAMNNVAVGVGTLQVRVTGQTTVISINNVAVGIVLGYWGQSNLLRGDNITGITATVWDWNGPTLLAKSWLLQLAQMYSDDHAGCVVQLIGLAVGSTQLSDTGYSGHWNKFNSGAIARNYYNGLILALRQMISTGVTKVIGHQGENDAFEGVSQSTYNTALLAFVDNLRNDVPALSAFKLTDVSIGRNDPVAFGLTNGIRYAQQAAWETTKVEAGGALADLATTDEGTQNVHFITVAQKLAVAQRVYRHVKYGGIGRGPKISSSTRAGAVIRLTFAGGVSPLTASGGELATPIGWVLTDDNGTRTVTSQSIAGLVLTLTCDAPLVGQSATLRWLYDNSGIGTTLLDSGTPGVPPEPFSLGVTTTDMLLQSNNGSWYMVRIGGAGPYTISVDQVAAATPGSPPAANRVLIANDTLHYTFGLSTSGGVTTVSVGQVATGAAAVASIAMLAQDGTSHNLTLINNAGTITYSVSQ